MDNSASNVSQGLHQPCNEPSNSQSNYDRFLTPLNRIPIPPGLGSPFKLDAREHEISMRRPFIQQQHSHSETALPMRVLQHGHGWGEARQRAAQGPKYATSEAPSTQLVLNLGKAYQDQILEHNASLRRLDSEIERRILAENELWYCELRCHQLAKEREANRRTLQLKTNEAAACEEYGAQLRHQANENLRLREKIASLNDELIAARHIIHDVNDTQDNHEFGWMEEFSGCQPYIDHVKQDKMGEPDDIKAEDDDSTLVMEPSEHE